MTDHLLSRAVHKRDPEVRLQGRALYLTEDPKLIRRQLAGDDLKWDPSIELRNDISTDEITPGWACYYHDETLGEFPYVGLVAGGENPIERNSVKNGGFVVSVSGKRRGKGSSREQSPFAEKMAGIQMVVAENIERIYHQNCNNLGILATTDFSLLDRVRRGESIPLSEFTKGADDTTRQIIEYGGLFEFNVARLQGKVTVEAVTTAARPMTLAEKIFARHMVVDLAQDAVGVTAVQPGDSGFVRTDLRFSHEYVTPMAAIFYESLVGADVPVRDKESILMFRDHLTFLEMAMSQDKIDAGLLEVAGQLATKQAAFAESQGIRLYGETGHGGSEAICHSKVLESYALPGQLIIGTDSHTPHSGAVGCLAFGVGTTAIFNSWVTQDTMVRVPENVKIEVTGQCRPGVVAKDIILEILRQPYVRDGQAIGKVVEYCGEAVEALSVDERATLTNMAAEVGAFTGIIAADEKTVEYLMDWRNLSREEATQLCEGMRSDDDAQWSHVITLDATQIQPMVALPGDPGNGVALSELDEVKIDIAYGGSCTAGKQEDMEMYARVLRAAVDRGERVHPDVTFWIQFGSQEVKRYCDKQGYLRIFEQAGAKVIEPSCGACINAGPGVSDNRDQVTVSAINRNFPGRSGPGQMYLASPLTVAASALAGYITAFEGEAALER